MQEISKSESFIKKNIIFIILAGVFCTVGMSSNAVLALGLLTFVVAIMRSSTEHRFCWSVFLVSNIRIFDALGVKFLVNILMVLPLLFYIVWKLNKISKSVYLFPLLGGLILFVMASSYSIYYGEGISPHIMWAMAFVWCAFVTIDKDVNVDKNDAIYALATGAIFSAAVFVLTEPDYLSNIMSYMNTGFRFIAYANDPNYYSMYMCISIAAIVIKPKIKLYDYPIMIILVCIGFLTESKMCMILMLLCLVYLVVFTVKNDKSNLLRNILILVAVCAVLYVLRDTVKEFLDNLLKRAGGDDATLNDVSSGRFEIVLDCLRSLTYDIPLLLIGRGFGYFNHFGDYAQIGRLSHNTYLDIVMTWGILGTIVFIRIITYWFWMYKKRLDVQNGYTLTSKFPFVIMLLSFFSLSCLDAGMFFFVITLCMLQLQVKEKEERGEEK